jgi:hypothetical protein
MRTNDEIDKLFSSKFENYKVDSSEDEWMKLNADLKRINFWQFHFQSFNIFYLIGIIGIAALVIIMLIIDLKSTPEPAKEQESIKYLQPELMDTIAPSQESDHENPEKAISEKKAKSIEQSPVMNPQSRYDTVKKVQEILPPQNIIVRDSLKTNPATMVREEPKLQADTIGGQPRIRKVKRTTVVKTETVIVRDTVDLNKKQK